MDNEANLEMSAYDLRQQGSQSNFNKKLNQKNSPLKLIPFSRQNYDRNLLKELQMVGDYTYETDKKNQIFYEDNASPNVSAKKEPSTDMSSDENYNKFTASQVKENTKVSRKSKKIKSKKKMVKKSDTENSENHDSGSAQIQYQIEHACDFQSENEDLDTFIAENQVKSWQECEQKSNGFVLGKFDKKRDQKNNSQNLLARYTDLCSSITPKYQMYPLSSIIQSDKCDAISKAIMK